MMQATRSSACGSQLPRTLCAIPCKQIAQFSAPAAGAAIDMDEAQPLFDEMPPRLQGKLLTEHMSCSSRPLDALSP